MKYTIRQPTPLPVKADVFRARTHNFTARWKPRCSATEFRFRVTISSSKPSSKILPTLHKYLAIRKRMLGGGSADKYDLYVPFFRIWTFDALRDAKSLVKEAYSSGAYGKLLDDSYTKGWIDVFETPARPRSILLGRLRRASYGLLTIRTSWTMRLPSASSLAMHALVLHNSAQPYETSQYRILLRSVASTVNDKR
jgi:oligoendopeptidase F